MSRYQKFSCQYNISEISWFSDLEELLPGYVQKYSFSECWHRLSTDVSVLTTSLICCFVFSDSSNTWEAQSSKLNKQIKYKWQGIICICTQKIWVFMKKMISINLSTKRMWFIYTFDKALDIQKLLTFMTPYPLIRNNVCLPALIKNILFWTRKKA